MMARRLTIRSFLLGCVITFSQAGFAAEPCGLDPSPASTLFLPYFEVDLENPLGLTTLFSVANASDFGVLAKVNLWTDLGIPTQGFFLYLTGYDVTTVNLRDVFAGRLPGTASSGQDPADAISPHGPLSQETNFPGCNGVLPPAPLTAAEVQDLRNEHLGLASARRHGQCSAHQHGDRQARGFVTVDTVNDCTPRTPSDEGYFGAGGDGDATHQNVLWGDFFYVDASQNLSQGESLVRIQSSGNRFTPGQATFYGWLSGYSAKDGREPLPSAWAARYLNGGTFGGGADLVVWHAPDAPVLSFPCSQLIRLRADDQIIVYDEQENAFRYECNVGVIPPGCGQPFWNVVAARTPVGGSRLPTLDAFGWLHLSGDLPRSAHQRQRWVGSLLSAEGRYGVGFAGTPLDTGCTPCPPWGCA